MSRSEISLLCSLQTVPIVYIHMDLKHSIFMHWNFFFKLDTGQYLTLRFLHVRVEIL